MNKRFLTTAVITTGLTAALLIPTVGPADARRGPKPAKVNHHALPVPNLVPVPNLTVVGAGPSGCGTTTGGTGGSGTTGGNGGGVDGGCGGTGGSGTTGGTGGDGGGVGGGTGGS